MTVRFTLVMMFFLDHVQEIMRLYHAIIGSGSVVTKNIPENVIAVVNPWSVLREIAEEDKVISL